MTVALEQHDREFRDLLDAFCDGVASESQFERLEHLIETNPAARRAYIDAMHLQASLQWDHSQRDEARWKAAVTESSRHAPLPQSSRHTPCAVTESEKRSVVSGQSSVVVESPSTSSQLTTDHGQRTISPIPQSAFRIPKSLLNHPGLFSAVSAAVFIIAGLFLLGMIRLPSGGETNLAKKNRPIGVAPVFVAQFTNAHDCVWGDEMNSPLLGSHLHADRAIDLRQGIAELTFRSGAVVLVEGPAKFSVSGKNRGRLDRGKLVARIEKKSAIGFAVATPKATVVDLGTEFGVEVDADGATDVLVYNGKVALRGSGFQPASTPSEPETFATLRAGKAMRVMSKISDSINSDATPDVKPIAYDAARFARVLPSLEPEWPQEASELADIRGLVLWLRADDLSADDPNCVRKSSDGNYVARWADRAGKFRGAADVVQREDGRQPRLIEDAIGGRPAVRFDRERGDVLANDRVHIVPPASARTMLFVGRASVQREGYVGGTLLAIPKRPVPEDISFVVQHYSLPRAPGLPRAHYVFTDNGSEQSNNGVLFDDATSEIVRPFVSVYRVPSDGRPIEVSLNGTHYPLFGRGGYLQYVPQIGFVVGGRDREDWESTQTWDGDIAEILVYDRMLSDDDLKKIELYLVEKYRLDGANR